MDRKIGIIYLHYVSDSSDTQGEVKFHKPIIEQALHIDTHIIQLYIILSLSFKYIKMHIMHILYCHFVFTLNMQELPNSGILSIEPL